MTVRIVTGHVIDVLRKMPAASFQTCVTSPPYWQQRNYGTEPQVWEGAAFAASCAGGQHDWSAPVIRHERGMAGQHATVGNTVKMVAPRTANLGQTCVRCMAWRGELGWEPTPDLFVQHLVLVFDEVWRVLADDGTCWVNLGDKMISSWANRRRSKVGQAAPASGERADLRLAGSPKEGDYAGVPWLFALAMQARGWYWRQTVAWAKRSALPEPVRDRPSNSWEPIFLFTKRRHYFYDVAAVRQPNVSPKQARHNLRYAKVYEASDAKADRRQPGNVNHKGIHSRPGPGGRNLSNVWVLSSEPSREEHTAAFPSEVPRRAILAGSRLGDTVLDPFAGSGRTLLVANELGRNGVGIDLHPAYIAISEKRLSRTPVALPLFPTAQVAQLALLPEEDAAAAEGQGEHEAQARELAPELFAEMDGGG